MINDSPDLSELRALIAQAGLEESLAGADPLTVFAPSNPAIEAFAATPEGAAILADPAQLEQLLLRHVAPGALDGQAVLAAEEIETASGDLLAIDADAMTVDGGELLVTDVSASNGFVHVVDRVLAAR
ncbi:MAG: fasciclin domain-containing protein [Ilumatobacter sp.]|nr:fasciclin domain-containing protein [Ilumatobacter sp.]